MNITSWTSAGINWEEPQLSSLYDALESIRLALLERLSITGIDYSVLGGPLKNIRGYSIYDVINTFNQNLISIIPYFVNHLNNNGNWNNAETIPAWTVSEVKGYGYRPDGSPKGQGFFGELIRYDDPESYSTEISVNVDGIEMPALVPTLTDSEVRWLLSHEGVTDDIILKAVAYAQTRIAANKSPFANDGEQNPRTWMPTFTHRLSDPKFFICQAYKIINKLKWVLSSITRGNIISQYYTDTEKNTGYDFIPDWLEAKNTFYADSWSGGYLYAPYYLARRNSYGYQIICYRSKISIPFSKYHTPINDFYLYAKSQGNQTVNGISFFDSEFKYALFKTESQNETGEYFIFTDGELLNSNLLEPQLNSPEMLVDVNLAQSVFIQKYDNSNGFKFLAS